MPAGIIRGALSRLGILGTVVPEVTTLPQCKRLLNSNCFMLTGVHLGTFQVKLPKGT
jgi:hypothetical protein